MGSLFFIPAPVPPRGLGSSFTAIISHQQEQSEGCLPLGPKDPVWAGLSLQTTSSHSRPFHMHGPSKRYCGTLLWASGVEGVMMCWFLGSFICPHPQAASSTGGGTWLMSLVLPPHHPAPSLALQSRCSLSARRMQAHGARGSLVPEMMPPFVG